MKENTYHAHETSGRQVTIRAIRGSCDETSVIGVGGITLSPKTFARIVTSLISDGYLKVENRQVARMVYEDIPTVVDPF